MDEFKLISRSEEMAIVVSSINSVAPPDRPLQILEAGCGQKWDIDLDDLKYVLTGVDLDATALKIRIEEQKDLDHEIVGDLVSVQLPENSFDVVYSYYVLEHIANARSALLNFLKWLRPGGIAIIKVPDPNSVHGFFAGITPHWFHVFYRHVLGNRYAGKPGHGPYTTYYDAVISRSGMRKFCADNSVSLTEFRVNASHYVATRLPHKYRQFLQEARWHPSLRPVEHRARGPVVHCSKAIERSWPAPTIETSLRRQTRHDEQGAPKPREGAKKHFADTKHPTPALCRSLITGMQTEGLISVWPPEVVNIRDVEGHDVLVTLLELPQQEADITWQAKRMRRRDNQA